MGRRTVQPLLLAIGVYLLGPIASTKAQAIPKATPPGTGPAFPAGRALPDSIPLPSAEPTADPPAKSASSSSTAEKDRSEKPEAAAKPSDESRVDLSGAWSNGLRFNSKDDGFRVHVGGSAHIDSNWLIGPKSAFLLPTGSLSGVANSSATFLRRTRLRVDGEIYDQFDFVVEYDFANANNENSGEQPPSFGDISGSPAPRSIWMQIRDVPILGDLRFGNMVKPIGMALNTSQISLPFQERPDNMDAFYGPFDGGYALGLAARNRTDDERMTWQFGIYRPAINVFGVALNQGEVGGRLTTLPLFEDDGCRLVHVGFGTLDGQLAQNRLRLRDRPLLRNGPGYANPILVDTGEIDGSRQYTLAPEFAAVYGPWSFQAEWTCQFLTRATLAGADQGTAFFHGGYAEALYFLTGEHQPYDKKNGVFGRVIPDRNLRFKRCEGCLGGGAWQAGLRYSYLDLNDKAIQGGVVHDWTAGLNWFWNPNMKVQFNYILEHRDQPGVNPAWINGIGFRGAYDF